MQISNVIGVGVYFIPIETRVPLKFGHEVLTSVTCARVRLRVADPRGHTAEGWGETPLSVQWVWPGHLPVSVRLNRLKEFVLALARDWAQNGLRGHPLQIGWRFIEHHLPERLKTFNRLTSSMGTEPMPHLAALLCNSAFDIALHDAYGRLLNRPVYDTYGPDLLPEDLAAFLEPAAGSKVSFAGKWPKDFLVSAPPRRLAAWHLVGGLDPVEPSDLTGAEPSDGHPVLLADWIRRDGLRCLKVKLRGNDLEWDVHRLERVGALAAQLGVDYLSADFNCTVREPDYVLAALDRLHGSQPATLDRILYVEQPFPYDLEANRIDVHSVSARKPLFLDESAHDWRLIRLGRELGWNGVALKTCKTQTGALLSACWARAHGLQLMVQDLTNPMLAQIPHLLLAAHVGTIMGVETNAMQFYPAASAPEARVHPGLFQRRGGAVDLASIHGPGFGYRLEEIHRPLPPAAFVAD